MANESKRDYYAVLGVQKNATDADLKKAYRKLAKESHPDLHPGDKAAEARFKELNEAYEVLSDGEKRGKYDQFGHAGVDPNFGAGGGFGGFDMGDIFSSFFGGFGGFGGDARQSRTGPRRGADVQTAITVTLEEAAFGCQKEINLTHLETCETCKGSGSAEGTTAEICAHCQGTGSVRVQQKTVFGAMSTTTVCPHCRGEGKIIHQPCRSCSGSGAQRKQKLISVNVPAGIDDGQAISLRGQGDAGKNGGPAGDLIIGIRLKPHGKLTRKGNTIHLDQTITFAQATLGAELEIPTLDGKVKYTIPEGTQTGTTFRLKDKGVPNLNGRGRGDQLVNVKVEVPKNLTKAQKEALRVFADAMEGITAHTYEEFENPDEAKDQKAEEPRGFFDKKRRKK